MGHPQSQKPQSIAKAATLCATKASFNATALQGLLGWRGTRLDPFAEFVALLWSHLLPTVAHALLHAVTPAAIERLASRAVRAEAAPSEAAQSAEEQPAQDHQSDSLPKTGERGEMEEAGREPVPQAKDNLAEYKNGHSDKDNGHQDFRNDAGDAARGAFGELLLKIVCCVHFCLLGLTWNEAFDCAFDGPCD